MDKKEIRAKVKLTVWEYKFLELVNKAEAEFYMVQNRYEHALSHYDAGECDHDDIMMMLTLMVKAQRKVDRLKSELRFHNEEMLAGE